MDGTFKVVKAGRGLFYQMFIISGYCKGNCALSDVWILIGNFALAGLSIPVCWTLLTGKSFQMYKEGVFEPLYKAMLKRNEEIHGAPIGRKEFVVDYKTTIYTAASEVFLASW